VDAEGEGTLTKPKLADETGEGTLTKPKLERPKEATADPWLVREYVRQLITPEVNEASAKLLSELQRLQERAHLKDPVKAAMRKRYVCGLREVIRSLKTNKARALLVAHNIEKIESEEGLDQLIAELVQLCDMKLEWVYDEQTKRSSQQLVERDGHVPIVFCFTRRTLARCLKRSAKASCVAVLSHDGASDLFHACMREADAARKRYEALTNAPDARLIASDGLCWPPSSGTRRSPTRIRRTASASDASSTSRSGVRPNRSRTTSSCSTRSRASGWTKRMAGEGCDNRR
jgi:selenocysteine insertion sequence-binding protein 2